MDDGAGGYVKLPAMPWTDKFSILDGSLAQWTTTMEADVVHGRVVAIYVGNANRLVSDAEFPSQAFAGQLRFAAESYLV